MIAITFISILKRTYSCNVLKNNIPSYPLERPESTDLEARKDLLDFPEFLLDLKDFAESSRSEKSKIYIEVLFTVRVI